MINLQIQMQVQTSFGPASVGNTTSGLVPAEEIMNDDQ